MSKFPASVSITRRSSNTRGDYIVIEITDSNSGLQVVAVDMDLPEFAKAVTGLSSAGMAEDGDHKQHLGKSRSVSRATVIAPNLGYDVSQYKQWVADNFPDGENYTVALDTSKGGIEHENGFVHLRIIKSTWESAAQQTA